MYTTTKAFVRVYNIIAMLLNTGCWAAKGLIMGTSMVALWDAENDDDARSSVD